MKSRLHVWVHVDPSAISSAMGARGHWECARCGKLEDEGCFESISPRVLGCAGKPKKIPQNWQSMTRGQLLRFLTEEAKRHSQGALSSLTRNNHMNSLSAKDILRFKREGRLTKKFIEALLVDFINAIGVSQGIDYGLHTKHLNDRA